MANTNYKIKKDDHVMVVSGKEKGKSAKVASVNAKRGTVTLEKLNIVKRHTKPDGAAGQGGIIDKEAPLNISNVMYLCTKCSGPVKLGRKILEDGTKVRMCRKCGEVIDK
ncbi:MAG: 50S ribosomal protein L24 [Proteobacteria bacterium]|nr:50S ribosomal protein L24 [Pseudomonadota bacterium]